MAQGPLPRRPWTSFQGREGHALWKGHSARCSRRGWGTPPTVSLSSVARGTEAPSGGWWCPQ